MKSLNSGEEYLKILVDSRIVLNDSKQIWAMFLSRFG